MAAHNIMLIPVGVVCVLALGACSTEQSRVRYRMSDAEIRSTIAAEIEEGDTEREVVAGLERLGTARDKRFLYEANTERGRVVLQRVFESNFLDSEDDDLEWVDMSFVFGDAGGLERVVLFRDRLRYFQREPMVFDHAPKRRLMARPGRWPLAVPGPIDPLEGGT